MTVGDHVEARGDAAAVVVAHTGATITYRELDERSMRLARRLHAHGLRPGDHIAVLLENHPRYFEAYWAAMRSGLYLTPVSWHLDVDDVGHVVHDCGAVALITSARLGDLARSLGSRRLAATTLRLVIDGHLDGFTGYEEAVGPQPARPLDDEREGAAMFYTSGTTDRPKGIQPPLSGAAYGARPNPLAPLLQAQWGFGPDTVYRCSLPLYHGAALGFSTCVQRLGGTVVLAEQFDPRQFLRIVEEHRVTHAQLTPIQFCRLLELAPAERNGHDLSSLRVVLHAGAPCPVEVKHRMLEWLGPIVHEYYTGAEGNGFTMVTPREWCEHPGTVGRATRGGIHILDRDGAELSPGTEGEVWFDTGARFEYHNAPEKTAHAFNDRGWSALGDLGRIDDDGYLHLTGRVADLIVTDAGIVNPRPIEDLLLVHPAVADVAVIGEDGEQVRALVQLVPGAIPGSALLDALVERCRTHLPAEGIPTSIEFVSDVGRLPTGKLPRRARHLRR